MGGKFKRLFWLWMQCFKSMRRLSTFVPFFLYAMLQTALLFSLVNFSQAPFSNLFIPVIRKLFGEPALHYPNFYLVLSPLYSQINIVFSGLIGIVIIGMATYVFAGAFKNERCSISKSFRVTIPKYGILFIIWIIETAFTLLMVIGLPMLLKNLLQPAYSIGRVFDMIGLLFAIIVASFFAYTTVLIILDRQKLGAALKNTFSIFKRNSITTFILIAVPTLIYFPINFFTGKAPVLINKFSPEMIILILGVGIFISFFTSYVQIGSITRFYLLLKESRRR